MSPEIPPPSVTVNHNGKQIVLSGRLAEQWNDFPEDLRPHLAEVILQIANIDQQMKDKDAEIAQLKAKVIHLECLLSGQRNES